VPDISRRSVLTVLGAGALAAGAASAVRAATAHPAAANTAEGPDNPIRVENAALGSEDWRIGAGDTVGADDLGRQIAVYATATTVNLSEAIDFHVSTEPARRFTVSIYRLGWYGGLGARQLTTSPTLPGVSQPEPVTDPVNGMIHCPWTPSWTLDVPANWTSGAYLAAFTTQDGHRSVTPFVVRDDARSSDFLVVLPFTTYQAYNQWPLDGKVGKSLYYGYGDQSDSGEAQTEGGSVRVDVHGKPVSYGARARTVSFARPYSGVGSRSGSTSTTSSCSGPSGWVTT